METWSFNVIGRVISPYKEKFAVPRQANLVTKARGQIVFTSPYNTPEAFSGLENYSHIWLMFVFDKALKSDWNPSVRPPRLGGNKKMGCFATRSPFRANPIGLSCVKLEAIDIKGRDTVLQISGLDLVDGTPIIDIKPFIPYADNQMTASSAFASEAPEPLQKVVFSSELNIVLQQCEQVYPEFSAFLTEVLLQDPRPAFHKTNTEERIYGMHIVDWNVKWYVKNDICYVTEIQ
ncbi:tRNA (N6-threonylcarbamoyladenosine(37)-N6)-methyltransferase TrmO [Catenovulum sediminis]|uniref:tRNA (N6-threonylcarbamoyladenosine(37)-N6)-methyltransferase TrmO n=1 Tax=Catenovulum sediminis TaxID=1740262 RepID=A0ABV1RLY9_9ALTE|nr:tRNA (N6-threonylcarbamoyladenosine(37)-N6)-methyltransferase TrmO [Catenovulum sediminis]